jgi:L-alanine-DL-glutamate epimerase-like enolase superfamily enzyme
LTTPTISICQRVEPYGLYWLEDVVAHDDYPGMAEVARTLNTPLAAGEYVYGSVPFRHMLEARSVDIVIVCAAPLFPSRRAGSSRGRCAP